MTNHPTLDPLARQGDIVPGSAQKVGFSLIIPTYNERENLPVLLDRIDSALQGVSFEVIVVDDDSPDKTWSAAGQLQAHYRWLRVIRRRGVRGLSSAVVCGFRQAAGEVLAVMDADLQHDVGLLPSLFQATRNADFAVATRHAVDGSDKEWSQVRRLSSRLATGLARIFARVPFSDPMSGFFAVRRDVFETIDDTNFRPRGYKILVYLYVTAARRLGKTAIRVREVGYHFAKRERGQSKLTTRVILDYFLMLMELRFRSSTQPVRPRWSHAIF